MREWRKPQGHQVATNWRIERLESRLHLNAADLDASFGVGGKAVVNYLQSANDTATRMIVMSDGRMVVGADSAVTVSLTTTHTGVLARFLANGQPDPTFGRNGQVRLPELGWTAGVKDFTLLTDGSILAIGSSQNGNYYFNAQKFTPAGAYDPAWVFDGTTFQDGTLSAVVALAGGKSMLLTPTSLWRLNANGSIDTTFGSGGKVTIGSGSSFTALSAAGQPDGSIVVGGYNNFPQHAEVRRYKADGTLDAGFGNGGIAALTQLSSASTVTSIHVAVDGTIAIAGNSFVARLLANGSLDSGFNGNGIQTISEGSVTAATITRLAVQTDGSYFAAGYDSANAAPFVAHLLVDGSLDANFGSGGVDYNPLPGDLSSQTSKFDLGVNGNGGLWFTGGGMALGASTGDIALTHIQSDGTLDPALGSDGAVMTDVLAPRPANPSYKSVMQPDGKLVMGGAVGTDVPAQFAVTRLNANGTLDAAFGTNGVGTVNFGSRHQTVDAVALQGDGKIVLVGSAEINPDPNPFVYTDYAIARFNANGTPDTTFGNGGMQQLDFGGNNEELFRVVIQADGSILASDATHLLRLLPDGTPDSSFGNGGLLTAPAPGTSPYLINLMAQPNGKILLGGNVTPAGLKSSPFVEKLNIDGTVDTTFGTNGSVVSSGASSFASRDFIQDTSGRFYVSGLVSPSGAISITRFTAAGAVDSTYATAGTATLAVAYDGLTSIAVAPTGQLIVLGTRRLPVTLYDAWMIRVSPTGQLDPTFGVAGVLTMDFGAADQFDQAFFTSTGRMVVVEDSGSKWQAIRLMGANGETSTPPVVTGTNLRSDLSAVSFTFNQNVASSMSVNSFTFVDALRNIPLKSTGFSYDIASNTATFGLPPLPPDELFSGSLLALGVQNAAGTMLDGNGDGIAGDNYPYSFRPYVPPAPTVTSPTGTTAHLTWKNISPNDKTRIQRSTDGINFTAVGNNTNTGITSIDDSGLTPGTIYTYQIQAYQSTGNSLWSSGTGDLALPTGNNAVYIKKNPDGAHADFWINAPTPGIGTASQQMTFAQLAALGVTGQSGNDTLTLDFSNGNPLPAGGISFDGGGGTNTLAIIGTPGDDTLTAGPSGLTFTGGTFSNVPINVANVQTIQFHGGSGGNDAINLASGNYNIDADTPTGTPNVSVTIQLAATATFTTDQHLANLTINGGTANLSTVRHTMFASALSITNNGLLDIANSFLYLPSTPANFTAAQTYWKNGYNLNSVNSQAPGIVGDWSGLGGITSSVAKTSYSPTGNLKNTIGVYDGAFAAANGVAMGPGANENTGASPNLSANQILIRPTLAGDMNGDGKVDDYDILIFNTFGFYNNGTTSLGTQVGDLNGDGKVNDNDILIFNTPGNYLNGTYPSAQPSTTAMTAVTTSPTASAQSAAAPAQRAARPAAISISRHDPAANTIAATNKTVGKHHRPAARSRGLLVRLRPYLRRT